uniref:Ricin B lectin domain-containing protein n=1 Tax=Mycena chlorophos TaxID=658473 RepID=A0ABQ0L6U4_MYCCL|nr:predicted protein [Mycena chlorophos]
MSCVPSTTFNLFDSIQNHVLDLANSVNPIIGQTLNANPTLNQQWSLAPVNGGIFVLANGVSQEVGHTVVMSYDTTAGTSPQFMQALAATTTSIAFDVICVTSESAFLFNPSNGLALTAWPAQAGSTISPVTFEALTENDNQLWRFQLLD